MSEQEIPTCAGENQYTRIDWIDSFIASPHGLICGKATWENNMSRLGKFLQSARKSWEREAESFSHLGSRKRADPQNIVMLRAIFCFLSLLSLDLFAQPAGSRTARFEAIRNYLSNPPEAAEIRFQKLTVSKGEQGNWVTNSSLYYGAYQDGSFFLEQVSPSDPQGEPITADGRAGDLLWHFRNGEVKKWKATVNQADLSDNGNIIRPLVGLAEIELLTAVNLGIPMLVNTSMQWTGFGFRAEQDLSVFKRDVPVEKARIGVSGTFNLSSSGDVLDLTLEREDSERPIRLVYAGYKQLATGDLDTIRSVSRQEFWGPTGDLHGFTEREVVFFAVPTTAQPILFGPERLSSIVRASFVYTNNSLYQETKSGYSKVVMANADSGRSNARVLILLALFGMPLVIFLWVVRHQFAGQLTNNKNERT